MTSNDESGNLSAFDRTGEVYKRLVAAVANGAVLFVGAGSSCRVGYPSWGRLLDILHDAIDDPDRHVHLKGLDGVDGSLRASEYRKVLGEQRYRQELEDAFAPRLPQHDRFHEMLVRLPFSHVLTTNYDYVLESAHLSVYSAPANSFDADEWKQLSDFRQSRSISASQRCYVHVHGSIKRPSGIVLCQADYNARYVHETRVKEFLKELLTGQRVVFVGFSLSDVDLDYILREVAGSLGIKQPRHFILLPAPVSSKQQSTTQINYTQRYHIEPVFFDNSSGDYSPLIALVDALQEDVDAELDHQQRKLYVDIDTVPQLVAHLLQDQPERQDDLQHRLLALLHSHAIPMTLKDTAGGTSDIDAAIDGVFMLVECGLPDDAIRKYESIRTTYEPQLTARHRYRLTANTGHALYSQGKHEAAAKAYLEATAHFRESRDAQGLEILAHILLRNTHDASRLAEELCSREPDFARARSLWIQAQPDDAQFADIEASVPEELHGDAEVALALSDLAGQTGNPDAAERYARKAVATSPDWTDALTKLATIILTSERATASVNVDQGYVPNSPDRVCEAEQALSAAIEHTPKTDPSGVLGGILYNRSAARRLLGDHHGARDDLLEAFRRDPRNSLITHTYAMHAEGEVEIISALEAIEAIPTDVAERDQLQFARLSLLLRRGLPEDIQRANTDVHAIVCRLREVTPSWLRSEIIRLGLHILTKSENQADYPDFVSSVPSDALPSYSIAHLTGYAELLAGDRERAVGHAKVAIAELNEDANWFERREVALLAENCGLHAPALNLWESVLGDNFSGTDTDHFVRCALVAGEWKRLLQACARLRDSGHLRRDHVLTEAHVLASSRETSRALSVLQEWLIDHPGDKSVRLQLSALALHHQRFELAEFDENKFSAVQELENANEGAALVYVLRRGESPNRAFEIAYDLYRRFPDSHVTHYTLIACVFDPSVDQIDIERPTVVGKNTAVCIRRSTDSGPFRWVYVESGSEPAVTRGEYGETHELVRSLWGKGAGDRVEFQGHDYEVVGVENKALRRVHEIMETFEENFPDTPLIRRFNVPTKPTPHGSPEEVLGEVYTELKKQAKRHEQLESMYTGNQLPLTCFATLMGRPVFDAVRYFAFEPSHVVRVHTGEANDWMGVLNVLDGKQELVLDSTALASALILDLLHVLPRIGRKFVVPQAAIDEVKEISLNAGSRKTSHLTIGFHQDRVIFHEASPEELAREVEALERVQRFVCDHCEVVGGESTLDLAAELRGQLESILGEAATDALALAKKRNAILWTDDLGIRALAASDDLHVRSAWTQVVMQRARFAGSIRRSDYDKCLCKLVRFRYAFTTLSARDIAMILRRAGWRAKSALGSAAIRLVADVALLTPHNCIIAGASFLLIWQQCRRRGMARDIIVAILEEIGRDRAEPLIAAVCSNPMPRFREKSVRPLKRMLRSWRGRDKEFRPGRMTRRGPIP